jgi:hypothetical protein
MILTYTKESSWKNNPNSSNFKEKKNSKSPDFYDKFQLGSKEYRRILVFFYFNIYYVAKFG